MHQKRCHVIYLKDSSLRSKQRFSCWITYLSFKGIFKLVRLTQAISSSRESACFWQSLWFSLFTVTFIILILYFTLFLACLTHSSKTFTFLLTFHLLLSSSRWSGVCFRLLASLLGKLSEKENRELKPYLPKLTWVHRWEGKPCASRHLLKASAHPPRGWDSPWTKKGKSRINKQKKNATKINKILTSSSSHLSQFSPCCLKSFIVKISFFF